VSKSIGELEQERGNWGPGSDWEKPKTGYPSAGTRFWYLVTGNQDNYIYFYVLNLF
jgi:hypothetical protein